VRHSIRIAVGPVQFRIGSDWAAPIAALEHLYRGYPQDETRPADGTVRLFPTRCRCRCRWGCSLPKWG